MNSDTSRDLLSFKKSNLGEEDSDIIRTFEEHETIKTIDNFGRIFDNATIA
jgi:hypothetical protein